MRECDNHPAAIIGPEAAPQRKKTVPKFAALSSKYRLPAHPIYPQTSSTVSTYEEEFEKYKNERLSPPETDLVAYWQVSITCVTKVVYLTTIVFLKGHQSVYQKLFPVSLNYLPIQASSVPCEHVFSSAGETDTKRRNRITAPLMEALQMLKFIYKKERLNFTAGWKTTMDNSDVDLNSDHLLAELFTADPTDTTDKLLKIFCAADSDDEEVQF